MNRRDFGAVAAVAAFTLLAAGAAATTAFAAQDGAVKCAGINNCKGESECQTATSSWNARLRSMAWSRTWRCACRISSSSR